MKDKIKEVQQYFIDRLLTNQFEITQITQHVVILMIDNYQFNIWMSNGATSRTHYAAQYNFMDLELNHDQCIILDSILKERHTKYLAEELYNTKVKELNMLKQELQMS